MATPISIDVAGELDNQWFNDGMPGDGLRIVGHRISGNRSRTFLTIPGRDDAPHYELVDSQYRHTAGPSVEAWLERQQAEHNARMERRDADDLYAWATGR